MFLLSALIMASCCKTKICKLLVFVLHKIPRMLMRFVVVKRVFFTEKCLFELVTVNLILKL